MQALIEYISSVLSEKIVSAKPVSGGDISQAYLLETGSRKFFLKTNAKPFAPAMFRAEEKGLKAIEETQTIAVPHVYLADSTEGKSFLLMDFVESKPPDSSDYERLGTQLARLHQCTHTRFGFAADNFIGSLPQDNTPHNNWAQFYWFNRIWPQLKMALNNGLLRKNDIPAEEKAIGLFHDVFGNVRPSLVHGDLWSGNYLIAANGTPYLIDPAAYYGHPMADLAMSKLFGGFGPSFYDAYHQIIPKPDNEAQQTDLGQLYYLLVHLNLFGSSYYSGVSSILKSYF